MKKLLTLLLLIFCQQAYSQTIIHRIVIDKNGEVLVGANIR